MVCQNHSQLQSAFKGHKDSVSTIAFSQDGQTLISASADKRIQIWRGDRA
jgi:WD40 repeat protein